MKKVLTTDNLDVIKRKIGRVENIEKLKQSNLKVGDVIEVLGYYSAGDGATHKRVIANEDDGSGVQLRSGLWANILYNGYIKVSWLCNKTAKEILLYSENKTLVFDKNITSNENIIILSNTTIKNKGGILKLTNGAIICFGKSKDWNNFKPIEVYYKYPALLPTTFKSNVSSNAKKGDYTIQFENVNNLKVGQYILVRNGYCNTWSLLSKGTIADWWRENTEIYGGQIVKVVGISENTVTIDSPLRFDLSITPISFFSLEEENTLPSYTGYNISNAYALDGVTNCDIELTIERADDIAVKETILISEAYNNKFSFKILNDKITNSSILFNSCYGNVLNNTFVKSNYFSIKLQHFCQSNKLNDIKCITTDTTTDSCMVYMFGCNGNTANNLYFNSDKNLPSNDKMGFYENTSFGNITTNIQTNNLGRPAGNYWSRDSIIENVIGENCYKGYACQSNYKMLVKNIISKNTIKDEKDTEYVHRGLYIYSNADCYFENLSDDSTTGVNLISSTFKNNYKNISFGKILQVRAGSGYLEDIKGDTLNIYNNKTIENEPLMIIKNIDLKSLSIATCRNVLVDGGTIKNDSGACVSSNYATYNQIKNLQLYGKVGLTTLPTQQNSSKKMYLENISFNTELDVENFGTTAPLLTGTIPRKNVMYSFIDSTGKIIADYKHIGDTLTAIESDWIKIRDYAKTSQLSTSYMTTKMQQEGVYEDYISYMDEKTAYDKQQRKLEQDRQLAYEEALKENPNLTYEEFMSVQPMTLNLIEEPQPSENLKKFMDKYL